MHKIQLTRRQCVVTARATGHGTHRPAVPSLRAHPTAGERRKVMAQSGAAAAAELGTVQQAIENLPTPAAVKATFSEDIATEAKEFEADVVGKFPTWLRGSFVKNGPGTFKGMQHLFDGYGMLVKFRFEDGHVFAANNYTETGAWKAFKKAGYKQQHSEFGTPIPVWRTLLNGLLSVVGIGQPFTDNANVHVYPLPGAKSLVALTEVVAGTYEVDIGELKTLRQLTYKDKVKGILTTAHPAVLKNGDFINLTSHIGKGYTVYRWQPGTTERQVIAEIPFRGGKVPCWVHDFPHTENYMILPETPCYWDLSAITSGRRSEYVVMDWKAEENTLLHVVPLNGNGPVRTVSAPKYFTFHYLNAFESDDGKQINIDFGAYPDPGMLNVLLLDNLRKGEKQVLPAPLKRMTVTLEGEEPATLRNLMKDDESYHQVELGRVNPNYKGKNYRYAYSVAAIAPRTYQNALAKYDVETGTSKIWHEAGTMPTEPIMVPRQTNESIAEDDGVVLSIVTGADGKAFLLCLDAASFTELGRAKLPFGITYQFHGNFIPA